MSDTTRDAREAWLDPLRSDLARLGVTPRVHARDVDNPEVQLGVRADEPAPLASTFKVLVVLELCRQAAAGECELSEPVEVPVEGRTWGDGGVAAMADPVTLSLRDLALMALSISDNAATDVLVRRVGLTRINATAAGLGLPRLGLPGTLGDVLDHHARQLGYPSLADLIAAEETPEYDRTEADRRLRESDLVTGRGSITGTARDLTELLTLIWRDEAGPAEACAQTRELMRHQVGAGRISTGYPEGDVEIASKTGTLPYVRNECGVIEYPDGGRYAVAVLTQTVDHARRRPDHDRLIGRLARAAVDALRAPDRVIAGGVNAVVRIGNTVRRPVGPWTTVVHALLRHLADAGFSGAPRAHGVDPDGREIVDFIEGEVADAAPPAYLDSDACLEAAAELLRRYHDASAGFALLGASGWQFPRREPAEVICHGDVAPYNCVFRDGRPVALIDFDTAHPGPRLWDAAYAAYRFVPLSATDNPLILAEQVRRVKVFCEVYGFGEEDRLALPVVAAERLRALLNHMRTQAAAGHPAFRRHIAEGHDRIYLADIAHLERLESR